MQIDYLHVEGLRSLAAFRLKPAPGINVIAGPNGAGKTSVLEAIYLLSHARSFRSGSWDTLLRRGAGELNIYTELSSALDNGRTRLGLGRSSSQWQARKDGAPISIGELVSSCAAVCYAPGSHVLIEGSSEERRRFLDWGVFHVEHAFAIEWRRYQRALKQRNMLLRGGGTTPELFRGWELELAYSAERIDEFRRAYIAQLVPALRDILACLMPELGTSAMHYKRGWSEQQNLVDAYEQGRVNDMKRMHTTMGAHRADWYIAFEKAPQREHLSRGQGKLLALACVLAQAALFTRQRSNAPIICLDDLASELDLQHQATVINHLSHYQAQILITATQTPAVLRDLPHTLFHVEQGDAGTVLL